MGTDNLEYREGPNKNSKEEGLAEALIWKLGRAENFKYMAAILNTWGLKKEFESRGWHKYGIQGDQQEFESYFRNRVGPLVYKIFIDATVFEF